MVLDFDVGKRIGQKIAVECSFFPNNYHQEKHWRDLLDFLVEREENVFPMVPAGARLDEVIRGLA